MEHGIYRKAGTTILGATYNGYTVISKEKEMDRYFAFGCYDHRSCSSGILVDNIADVKRQGT